MSGSEGFLQPCSDAFSATERPGDATAGPPPPARGPLEPWRGVWGGAPLTSGAVAPPSALGLLFPRRMVRGHSKPCATLPVSRG